jgi:hypothetical protein
MSEFTRLHRRESCKLGAFGVAVRLLRALLLLALACHLFLLPGPPFRHLALVVIVLALLLLNDLSLALGCRGRSRQRRVAGHILQQLALVLLLVAVLICWRQRHVAVLVCWRQRHVAVLVCRRRRRATHVWIHTLDTLDVVNQIARGALAQKRHAELI